MRIYATRLLHFCYYYFFTFSSPYENLGICSIEGDLGAISAPGVTQAASQWVRYLSQTKQISNFPLLHPRQMAPAVPPSSNAFTSCQCLHLIRKEAGITRVGVTFFAPWTKDSSRSHGSWAAAHGVQFVRPNRRRLGAQLAKSKAKLTASERAASLRSAWHQRLCRPLTDNKSTWCHIWLLV